VARQLLRPVALPAVPASYQPQELARPLRDGALHETAASGLMPYPWVLPQYEAAIGEGPFSLGQPPAARPGAATALAGAVLALLATADAPHDKSAAAALPPAANRAARSLQSTIKLFAGAAVMLDQPPVHSRLRCALLPPALLPARVPVPRLMPVAVPWPSLRFWEAGIACALPGPPPEWLPAHFLWAPAQPFLWAYPQPPAWLVASTAASPPTGPLVLHGYRAFASRVPTMPLLALGTERFDDGGAPADGLVRDANDEVLAHSEVESWSFGGVGGALRCAHIGACGACARATPAGQLCVPPDLAAAAGVPPGMAVDLDAPSTAASPAPRQAQTTTPGGSGGRWDDDSESDPDDEDDPVQDSKGRRSAAAAIVASVAAHGGAGRRGSGGPGKAKPEAAACHQQDQGALLQASRLGGLSLDALVQVMLPHTAALDRSRTFAVSSGAGAASPMAGASSPSDLWILLLQKERETPAIPLDAASTDNQAWFSCQHAKKIALGQRASDERAREA